MRWPWQGHRWDAWPWWNVDEAGIVLECGRCGRRTLFGYDMLLQRFTHYGGAVSIFVRDLLLAPTHHAATVRHLARIAGFSGTVCGRHTEVTPAADPHGTGRELTAAESEEVVSVAL